MFICDVTGKPQKAGIMILIEAVLTCMVIILPVTFKPVIDQFFFFIFV